MKIWCIEVELGVQSVVGIDLFSGAGGMSLGAELAGVYVKYAVEKDIHAAQTYQFNHPNTTILNIDIRNVTNASNIFEKSITILFGGAPCQGFSSSNRRTNNRKNADNWLYKEFIRIIHVAKPDWVVFENVTGIIEMESGKFFKDIVADFESVGYTCSYKILNAVDFGVPQKRVRLFLVGSKNGKFVDLSPTKILSKVTVKDALSDLPQLDNGASENVMTYAHDADSKYAKAMRGSLIQCSGHLVTRNADYVLERYKYIKQGENWSAIPSKYMRNYTDPSRCHTGIYHRLREDDASVVIGNYRKNMLIHPWNDRGLSVREAARLQSFPDNYVFKGSIGFQQQQVGNAVPPLLAKHVFRKIIEQL